MVNKLSKYLIQAGTIVSLFCFLPACSDNVEVVASVGETELTEGDALILMRHLGYDYKDKEQYRSFVEDWCENEVYKAELRTSHPSDWNLIELRSKRYSGDLAKYYLEEVYLKSKLDTTVSDQEITEYYEAHKDEFVLHDYIVKALYLKIPKEVDFKADEVHLSYLLKNDKDLMEINSYAKLYAENYYFNDSTWKYFDEIAEDIPLEKYNVDNIVLNRTKTYFSDEEHWYFLNIIDYKLKDEAPPLGFLREQIQGIIVSRRLNMMREENEAKMIKDLKKKHEIHINI